MMKYIKKALNLSEVFRVINETFKGFRGKLFFLICLGFLGGLLDSIGINILIPIFAFFIKDNVAFGTDFISRNLPKLFYYLPFRYSLVPLLILAFSLFLLRAFIQVISSYLSAKTAIDFKNQTVREMLGLVFGAKWTFLLKQKLGFVQTTILKDMQVSADMMTYLGHLIVSFTGLLVYFLFALSISAGMTTLSLLVGGVFILALFPIIQRNRALAEKVVGIEKSISSYLIENIFGVKYIKSLTVEHEVLDKGSDYYNEIKRLSMKSVFLKSSISNFMQPLALIFISTLFYYYYKQPNFNLPAFIITVYLIQKIFLYMETLQSSFNSVSEYVPFLKNILSFKYALQSNTEEAGGNVPFQFNKSLSFRNVVFSYDGERPMLADINIKINKGEVVGLIGPSGAGKSSLADLLLKFLKPQQGAIFLDETNILDINVKNWREHIGYVSQDIFLLNDTIEHNISFYDARVTKADITRAAEMANIFEFVNKQKEGLSAMVGERGVLLSGGQKQRIVLARILARKPSILILDEATSALDNESELLIQHAINGLRGKITVLIIAHRLSTVMDADKLFVLDDGRIVEEGDPKKLIQNEDSYFHRIYHLKN